MSSGKGMGAKRIEVGVKYKVGLRRRGSREEGDRLTSVLESGGRWV